MSGHYLEYPFSKGHIHITSNDLYTAPDFNAGFLSHPADLSPQIWAYKKNREIIRRMVSFRGDYAPSHPSFPKGSAASCHENNSVITQAIEYTEEDDLAIENWVRNVVETTWHSMYVFVLHII
jgi:alcohol oxidase